MINDICPGGRYHVVVDINHQFIKTLPVWTECKVRLGVSQ